MVRAILFALIYTSPVLAPVPQHLFPPEPVQVGARWIESGWWDHNYRGDPVEVVIEVTAINRGKVTYIIVGHPEASLKKWFGYDWNEMPIEEARKRIQKRRDVNTRFYGGT